MWRQRKIYGLLRARKLSLISADGIKQVLDLVRRIALILKQKYHAKTVWVFGSLVNGAFSKSSDIDIAVKGVPASVFYRAYADVTVRAGERNVDLVDIDDCSPEFREAILRDGKLVA